MSILSQLNSPAMYAICGGIVAFVALICIVFLIRAWRAGLALGMDPVKLKRVVVSSATFSALPSVGILLGVIETFSKAYLSPQFSDAIVFAVLIVILLVKPAGLLGKQVQEKV